MSTKTGLPTVTVPVLLSTNADALRSACSDSRFIKDAQFSTAIGLLLVLLIPLQRIVMYFPHHNKLYLYFMLLKYKYQQRGPT
jgi:hypothetical protein